MQTRRTFLAGAAALSATPAWSAVGNPTHVAAARHFDGTFWLHGIGEDGADLFSVPLPGRGHAAAAHPARAEAVAFARRPGTFALILDCPSGRARAELTAPTGHHFYGHGVFSQDGTLLFTTENAYDLGEGRVGVWDATAGYQRIASLPSYGIGPHEIVRLSGTDTMVVANGGIETHPDTGRSKLNLPMMRPNLSYLTTGGELLEQVHLPDDQRLNSIRHIAASSKEQIAIGCQWQGNVADTKPLLWTHQQGQPASPLSIATEGWRVFQGYIGSVAWSSDGKRLIATSPRGGMALMVDQALGPQLLSSPDICGAATAPRGALLSAGRTLIQVRDHDRHLESLIVSSVESWDNHITMI